MNTENGESSRASSIRTIILDEYAKGKVKAKNLLYRKSSWMPRTQQISIGMKSTLS